MEDKEKLLSARIKNVRKTLNLKQVEMADLLEQDQSTYSRVENGIISPTIGLLETLIYKIKVHPMYFFFGEGEMFRTEEATLSLTKFATVKMEEQPNYTVVTIKVPNRGNK